MALLAWIKSRKVFLKVQEGTGDSLSREDIRNGFTSCAHWSTFEPEDLESDDSLEMSLVDGGVLMCREELSETVALPDCYQQAFDEPFNLENVVILCAS